MRLTKLVSTADGTPWIDNIREYTAWAKEDIIITDNSCIYRHIVLHL
ncbi:hypothetical protein EVA_11146, partial [gut metagenome]